MPGIRNGLKKRGFEMNAISAVAGTNVRDLLYRAAKLLEFSPSAPEAAGLPVYRAEADPRAFTVRREKHGWRVSGESIERAASMTYWEYDQSVERFQRILQTIGVEDALRKAGVAPGDIVLIGEYELEWQD